MSLRSDNHSFNAQGACSFSASSFIVTAALTPPPDLHPLLFSVKFARLLGALGRRRRRPGAQSGLPPRPVLREPVGDAHGEAQEPQADAVDLSGDGDLAEEGVVSTHGGAAAFKVFDNVEDLLPLGLPHHPAHVQQGGDVPLPLGWRDAKRKRVSPGFSGNASVQCRQCATTVMTPSSVDAE